ncbi:ArsR/SmtB family transcription factor [Verrucomicrobiota bacterium sgz303538]
MHSSDPRTLPPAALEIIADRFKALSEPTRLRLLNALMSGERSVSQLVEATGINQASVSKHLGQLADASMVGRRREGPNVIYFISDETIFEICRLMCAKLQKDFGDTAARFH